MLDRIDQALEFQSRALALRAERQQVLAGNIANADTPNYKAVDFNFADALRAASGRSSGAAAPIQRTHASHLALGAASGGASREMLFRVPSQPAIDNNTVDMELERAQFMDNAVRYEATLRFLNGQIRGVLAAIQTQNS